MIKKFTFLLMFLAVVAFPSLTKAQTFTLEQNAVIEELKAQLIQMLLQQIAILQEQIKQLVAQQNLALQQSETSGAVEAVSKQVEDVSKGGSATTTLIHVGEVSCVGVSTDKHAQVKLAVKFPLTIEGYWVSGMYQVKSLEGKVLDGEWLSGSDNSEKIIRITIPMYNNPVYNKYPEVKYEIKVYNQPPTSRSVGGHSFLAPWGNTVAEKSGTFTLPSCQ